MSDNNNINAVLTFVFPRNLEGTTYSVFFAVRWTERDNGTFISATNNNGTRATIRRFAVGDVNRPFLYYYIIVATTRTFTVTTQHDLVELGPRQIDIEFFLRNYPDNNVDVRNYFTYLDTVQLQLNETTAPSLLTVNRLPAREVLRLDNNVPIIEYNTTRIALGDTFRDAIRLERVDWNGVVFYDLLLYHTFENTNRAFVNAFVNTNINITILHRLYLDYPFQRVRFLDNRLSILLSWLDGLRQRNILQPNQALGRTNGILDEQGRIAYVNLTTRINEETFLYIPLQDIVIPRREELPLPETLPLALTEVEIAQIITGEQLETAEVFVTTQEPIFAQATATRINNTTQNIEVQETEIVTVIGSNPARIQMLPLPPIEGGGGSGFQTLASGTPPYSYVYTITFYGATTGISLENNANLASFYSNNPSLRQCSFPGCPNLKNIQFSDKCPPNVARLFAL